MDNIVVLQERIIIRMNSMEKCLYWRCAQMISSYIQKIIDARTVVKQRSLGVFFEYHFFHSTSKSFVCRRKHVFWHVFCSECL